jgi:hypothetical protein
MYGNNTVTWRLKAGVVKSGKTVIARQRLVETCFRSNKYVGIYQRVAQIFTHGFMETANNKGMNCCTGAIPPVRVQPAQAEMQNPELVFEGLQNADRDFERQSSRRLRGWTSKQTLKNSLL